MDLLYAKRSLRGQVFKIEDGGFDSRGSDTGYGGGGYSGNPADRAAGLANPTGQSASMSAEDFASVDKANYDAMTAANKATVDKIGSFFGLTGRAVTSLFGNEIAAAMARGQLSGTNSAYAASGGGTSNGFDGGGDRVGDGSGSGSGSGTGTPTSMADIIADALSHDPGTQAFNTTKTTWDNWVNKLPGMQTQVDTLGTRGNTAYDNSVTAATGLSTLSTNALSDYDTVFRPNYQRLNTEVQRYGTQAYQDQMSDEAMAGVQSNIDSQRMQLQRNRNRMGFNPASTGMDAQLAIGAATAKAAAARDAVFGAKKAYTDGLTGMSQMGLNVANMGNTASNTARAWGDYGLKSSAAGLTAGLELQRLGGTLGASTVNSYNGITNAGSGRIQANNGTMTAQAAQDANNPWTTLLGAGVSAGLSKWLGS